MKSLLCMIFFGLVASVSGYGQEQTDSLPIPVNRLDAFYNKLPQEQIYVHFNKPYYAIGDAIWFKVYVTLGNEHFLSSFSKIVYMELLNPSGDIVTSLRLPVTGGISFGDFRLSDSLSAGSYKIRGYTQWMRNFSPDAFFERNLAVGKAGEVFNYKGSDTDSEVQHLHSQAPIRIYPEGGKFQKGVRNDLIIQFPATNVSDLSGWFINRSENQRSEVNVERDGFARVGLVPKLTHTYGVEVKDSLGHEYRYDFDVKDATSYSLKVNNFLEDDLLIQLGIADTTLIDQPVSLLIQHNGEVFYAVAVHFSKPQALIRIPKSVLGTGIREISLFSDRGDKPLITRSVFILNAEKRLPLEVTLDKPSYNVREKVRVRIKVGDIGDSSRVSSLSASVLNMDRLPLDSLQEDNIFSGVLLERAGNGRFPWIVGDKDKFQSEKAIDDYMITLPPEAIWSRLDSTVIRYPIEQAMAIRGKVTRYNGKPEPHAHVTLFSPDAGIMIDTVANEAGVFEFDRLLFYDSVSFVIQARTAKGRKHLDIQLERIPQATVIERKYGGEITMRAIRNLNQYLGINEDYYLEMYRSGELDNSILLNEVRVNTPEKRFENSSNLNGPGNADQILTSDQLSMCSDLAICLQGRLMGVVFKNGVPYSTRSQSTPMRVIVDGMPMEGDVLSMISPMDVDFIEVLRRPGSTAIYGSMGGGGVILVTTKQGATSYKGAEFSPGVVTYSPQGFYKTRHFPDTMSQNDPAFEHRTTIYWSPNLVTDENGVAHFEFFTSGDPGKYRILVEGIDLSGRLGREVLFFEVEE